MISTFTREDHVAWEEKMLYGAMIFLGCAILVETAYRAVDVLFMLHWLQHANYQLNW